VKVYCAIFEVVTGVLLTKRISLDVEQGLLEESIFFMFRLWTASL
jgi:hypothetical protein